MPGLLLAPEYPAACYEEWQGQQGEASERRRLPLLQAGSGGSHVPPGWHWDLWGPLGTLTALHSIVMMSPGL